MSDALNIAILGAGQLGGSFALALREAGAQVYLTAYDPDDTQAQTLLAHGAIDRVAATVADAVTNADMVMLAAPLRSYRQLAASIAPHLAPQAIVTDLGSVKGSMQALAGTLPAARLVPGHPIAGGEKSGAMVARADLFRGKLLILTPDETADEAAVAAVESLWQLAGSDVLRMPTPVHDAIYAYVSHLPHIIAFAAAETLYHEGVQPEGDEVLQRFLRISRSSARMWTDVLLENREALLPALGTYIAVLEHFARELASGAAGTDTDRTRAAQRFLPRILAGSLISAVSLYEQQSGMSLRPFGAGGMRDIVAPAATDPEGELTAMSDAAATLAGLIHTNVGHLRALESLIGAEDAQGLLATLSQMVSHAHALVNPRQ